MEGVPCLSPGQKHKTVIVLCVSSIFSFFFSFVDFLEFSALLEELSDPYWACIHVDRVPKCLPNL